MNIERRKEMGLEIGRAIHINSGDQEALYKEIMKVATSFCDKTSIACGMAMVGNDTDDIDMMRKNDDLIREHLEEINTDDETKEIIPE